MLHHIMMQNISKKSPWIVEVDDAFLCDDGTIKGNLLGLGRSLAPRTKTAILLMRINEIINESDGQTAKVN